MKIHAKFLKFPACKTISLDVEPTDTIKSVKDKIQKEKKIPRSLQRLLLAGKILENKKTISDYKIAKNATLDLILRFSEDIQIDVKIPNGHTTTIETKPSTTIKNLISQVINKEKGSLAEMENEGNNLNLFSDGRKLEKEETLFYHKIKDGSTLLLGSYTSKIPHVILELNSKKIPLNFYEQTTVLDLKTKIEEIEGIPIFLQCLKFRNIPLNDDDDLLIAFLITNGSVVTCELKSPKMIIYVKFSADSSQNRRLFTIEVEVSDKISEVKSILKDLTGHSSNRQRLFFGKKELDNEKTLYDYNIKSYSTLCLGLDYGGDFSILVKTQNEKKFILMVKNSDKVGEVKEQIEMVEGIPICKQVLLSESKVLDDEKTLEDYEISQDTILQINKRTALGPCVGCKRNCNKIKT